MKKETMVFNLEEYERILGEHGHRYVYYPKDIIQETLRKYLIQELTKILVWGDEKNKVENTVNLCIRGY